jgi:hypothetical protein
MDLFLQLFDQTIGSIQLQSQCPFVENYKDEYLKCFRNQYVLQEFDWMRFINDHSEIEKKCIKTELQAYKMWTKGGRVHGFVIESNEIYQGFPWSEYLKYNPKLRTNGIVDEIQAVRHWIDHGRNEKRTVNELMGLKNIETRNAFIQKMMRDCITEIPIVREFDWNRYLLRYPDIKQIVNNEKQAYQHWKTSGINEGRTAYILDKNEYYNTPFLWKYYLEQNPDLKHLKTEIQCYNHWVDFGRNQKRDCWKKQYVVNKKHKIFENEIVNEEFLKRLSVYVDHNVYNTELNLGEIDAKMKCLLDMDKDKYDFTTDILDSKTLSNINKNIQTFSNFIKPYTNIILICSDYPGYGGAATNSGVLSSFYSNAHNITSIYITRQPRNDILLNSNQYVVSTIPELQKLLLKFPFKLDLIILKTPVNIDFQSMFLCPIIFLIPGIYTNSLNKNYKTLDTLEKQNNYINKNVLLQIGRSDFTFCNSAHVQSILSKWYNVKTRLYYSTFVQFYNQTIIECPDFDKRKYDYGLIVSDFNRLIKNVNNSIQFLKDKKNVILIGKGSHQYSNYGFECVDLKDPLEMPNYYKQIKYIVQDSHFEGCSNVIIEGIFNGCKMKQKYHEYNVVVSSTQYAGYGGAATNAYQIIKFLRQNGVNTVGVFFHNRLDVNYDPEKIGGIFLYLSKGYKEDKVRRDVKSYLKSEPNYCLAKNYRAPYLCKELFNCYTVYLVSGINHFNLFYPTTSAIKLLEDSFIIGKNDKIGEEIKTCTLCESIIVNSRLTYEIFMKIYPEYVSKLKSPLDTTFCIKRLDQTFEKEYDIILICSNFKRESKNNLFLLDVLKNRAFDNYKKVIIGESSDLFESVKNVTILPLQIQAKCLEYMIKSKLLLHPALYESNSNTIREAYYHKCLPMITRNVGYNELFPDYLICSDFTGNEWVNKVNYVLDNYNDVKNTVIDFNTSLDIDKLLV